jgi:putative CocE/NonD family hydrolase
MLSRSRRRLLRQIAALSAAGLWLEDTGVRSAIAAPARAPLWAHDAAGLRVSPGLWATAGRLPPGVHFESLRLEMPDGVRIAALLYLPDPARRRSVPAAMHVVPYRQEPSGIAAGMNTYNSTMGYLAAHGYAEIYVDVRGTGGSEGVPTDEYTVEEHADTVRIIDWLSKQRWSNGAVGMYGTSYSAFNSVQIASEYHPPALKAIFALCGTDDRYTDDIHHPGGIMLMVDNSWVLGMVTSNATPAAPDFELNSKAALDRWNTPPWLQVYLHHQLDGPHWRRGSLARDYSRLKTPTFLGGGYLDIYQNFVPRIMRYSPAVSMGIMGPWHHSMTWPGPVLDWAALRVRWFDHWLKGIDTGMLREPRVSFYLPEWRRQRFRDDGPIPGDWRFLDAFPDTVYAPTDRLYLRPSPELPRDVALGQDPAPGRGGTLGEMAGPASALKLRYHPGRGGTNDSFGPDPSEGYYGVDARDENVYGLCFDTPPLKQPLEMLGFAHAHLYVSATAPLANWIVQLFDVAPDGTSYFVSRGYLNGSHRRSHVSPEPLVPNEMVAIDVHLNCSGYRFSPGHVIRTVVTNAEFPVVWPSPYPMTTTLYTGGDQASFIALPVLPALKYREGHLPILADAVTPGETWRSGDGVKAYTLTRDLISGETVAYYEMGDDKLWCRVKDDDPARASMTQVSSVVHTPEGAARRIETQARSSLTSTADSFTMDIECTLLENDRVVRVRRWQDTVRREWV